MPNTFPPNLNSAKMGLGKTKYENQTCRQEVLDGLATRKKRLEKQLKSCQNATPPTMPPGGGAAARLALECYRLKCKLSAQRRLLAIREEKKAKCFNDPTKDDVPGNKARSDELKEERKNHDIAIAETRDSIGNTKREIGERCR